MLFFLFAFIFSINAFAQDNLKKAIDAVKKGDYVAARDLLKDVVKNNKDYEPNYYYGLALYKTGSLDDAEKFYKISLKDDDEGIGALKGLGDLFSTQKKYSDANGYYKKALKIEPENIDVMIAQAKNFSLDGKIDDAIKVLTLATTYSKENPEVYVGLGDAYSIRGAYDLAIKYYKDALKLDKNNSHAFFGLGGVYFTQGKYDDAIIAYKSATSLDPNYAEAHLEFGKLLYYNGDFPAAAFEFQQYAKLVPGSPEGNLFYGRTLYKQQKYDEAIALFEEVLKVFPNSNGANRYLGLIYLDKKDFDKALEYFGKIEEKELTGEDYTKIGILYAKKKSFTEAYKYFNKALTMDTAKVAGVYFELGTAQFDNNEYENCIVSFDKALENGLKQFPVYLYQGISYFYMKNYETALSKLQESIKLNDQFAFTYLWVGKSNVGLLKKEDAIKAYNKCLELDPTNEEALKDLKSVQLMNFDTPAPNNK